MRKTFSIAIMLMLGLAIQAQAASLNANQGQGNAQTVPVGQDGNAIQTNEQNKVVNQGESTQIQTQEQNTVQIQDGAKSKNDSGLGAQQRSQVASAVQAMLQIAERNEGIGQQVRTIAQNQNQNQLKLDISIKEIQDRGGFVKFFIGANYGEIKDAQKTLEQNREQLRQMNQIKNQLSNEGDQQQLAEQIKVLEQANQEIETLLNNAQSGFSLFGWLNKLIS